MNSFIECYKKMMKNYANFNGRTTRADFWKAIAVYFVMNLIIGIPNFIVSFIQGFNAGYNSASGVAVATGGILSVLALIFGLIEMIFALAHLVPMLAMEARRLHDTNKSAWFLLLNLLSFCCGIGAIILIVFYCLPAVEEGKQYGDYV